ncbi:MAG TPA: ABC transporter ATP-binding protein [Microthrixaceae bacterium]|nr:ABC transporter ATP-binding protein [Microthrixaceae bacterium]
MDQPADRPAHLSVEGVTKSFDHVVTVLAGVALDVPPGSTVALLGPSGCGKTTLLRIVAGLETPDSGSVKLGGQVLSGSGVFVAPERRRIGMVFQDWALFPHLSVGRNVGFGLPRGERKDSSRITEALAMVGLDGLENRAPVTLSGGQQQRVALARALAPRPEMLLLDEPFSNLDASLRGQVRGEVHNLLSELGITAVFVTHDQDEAFVLGDSVAVMSAGEIVQFGTPEQIYQAPATRWVADFVGDANFVAGSATGATVDTVLGRLELAQNSTGPIEVLIRPEDLSIRPEEPDEQDSAGTGTVTLVEYLGHGTRYLVDCDGVTLAVRRPSVPILERGQTAVVEYAGTGPVVAFEVR